MFIINVPLKVKSLKFVFFLPSFRLFAIKRRQKPRFYELYRNPKYIIHSILMLCDICRQKKGQCLCETCPFVKFTQNQIQLILINSTEVFYFCLFIDDTKHYFSAVDSNIRHPVTFFESSSPPHPESENPLSKRSAGVVYFLISALK